jgi:hypothetical protein
MSVIVISKWRGDPASLEALLRSRPEDFTDLAAKARSDGALHTALPHVRVRCPPSISGKSAEV